MLGVRRILVNASSHVEMQVHLGDEEFSKINLNQGCIDSQIWASSCKIGHYGA
jgi:hypothetical protein